MSEPRVVITGVGCLGAFGTGLDQLAAALAAGRALTSAVDRSSGYHRANAARTLAACSSLDLSPWLSPQAARRMSNLSQFAVAAARMAIADAQLDDVRGDRTAVTIATALGPGGFTEQLARQVLEKGGKAASPFLFTDCVANAAAGQIAIDLGARGANTTICQREAGPLLALAHGVDDIRYGRADVCLAGAVDEMNPLSHAILDRFRALARAHGEVEAADEQPRPFDRQRNGVLAGEGATVVVLESEAHARARNARVLARVAGSARAFDPSASRTGFGSDAEGLAVAVWEQLGALLNDVDTVVSTASGAVRGDALEGGVLRAVAPRARVLAPKAVHGEYGGGTLAAALLALRGSHFALPIACTEPDPALGIHLAPGDLQARRVLCSALAAGGVAAWALLDQPQPEPS